MVSIEIDTGHLCQQNVHLLQVCHPYLNMPTNTHVSRSSVICSRGGLAPDIRSHDSRDYETVVCRRSATTGKAHYPSQSSQALGVRRTWAMVIWGLGNPQFSYWSDYFKLDLILICNHWFLKFPFAKMQLSNRYGLSARCNIWILFKFKFHLVW